MVNTLNIIKCGLFSSNIDICTVCSRVLSKIGQEINEKGGELVGQAWEWFYNNKAMKNQNQDFVNQDYQSNDMDKID